jgi:hypothetical protein
MVCDAFGNGHFTPNYYCSSSKSHLKKLIENNKFYETWKIQMIALIHS